MVKQIVFVEGNIGSGKSTFLRLIKEQLDHVEVVLEPLDVWLNFKDDNGKNILQYFYEDQKRYAYTFQTIAFLSRIEKLKQLVDDPGYGIVFVERSIFSDYHIFAENCFCQGLMTTLEWNMYKTWFRWIENLLAQKDRCFLYLQCSPEVCFQRMKTRNRKEENNVPLEYLTQIHERHEEWLLNSNDTVLKIDASTNFISNPILVKERIESLFLNK